METTNTIRIPNPSKEFVAFIEKAQPQKKERMTKICDKYRNCLRVFSESPDMPTKDIFYNRFSDATMK